MAGNHLSKDFFDLIKLIGEAKSKQEEDRIVTAEMGNLKRGVTDRTLSGRRLKEYLIRVIYVEMLGHDASFGYMKSVELSASANLAEKRVAYLAAALCLAPENDFRMMLVNRLQRDLQSANVLECSIALSASAKLITADMIPAVLPIVTGLLSHDQEIVRKKAIMLLQRFLALQPDSVAHLGDKFRAALCDRDPSVMGASLHVFYDLVKADPSSHKDLVSSFVSILKQVTDHRLPREFDYHRMPAPWIQMKLLRILSLLGRADQAASEQMYEVLLDVMRKADAAINVGYAIIYECVRTVTSIYPNTALLDAAAAAIGRFIQSDNHNLKYLGVTGLASIVKDHPRYAGEHQLAVIDCLEDPDDTLKRKTLDLLFRMTNPVNAVVIVDKLMSHLRAATDVYLRTDLVARISQAAEQFAPSNDWYIATMATVFELGGDLVRPEVAQNLIRLIAEGTGEDEAADDELRRHAVATFTPLLETPALPDVLLQVLFWTLGEYGYLSAAETPLPGLCEKLCALAQRAGLDISTRGYAIAAVLKLAAQLVGAGAAIPPTAMALLESFAASRNGDLAQRCHEFTALAARPALMTAVLPVDASTEDIAVDAELHFLDGFVAEALSAGARPYAPPSAHDDDEYGAKAAAAGGAQLRFEEYKQEMPSLLAGAGGAPGAGDLSMLGGGGAPGADAGGALGGLNLANVKGNWGREGYRTDKGTLITGAAPPPPPVDAAPASASGGGSSDPFNMGGARQVVSPSEAAGLTPQVSARAPAAAPAPPKPRELTEREKQAAALFGGISSAPAPAPAAGGRRPGAPAPAPAPAAVAAAPKPAPAPAPAPAAAADDLLGMGGMFGASTASAPAAPAPSGPLDLSSLTLPPALAAAVTGPGVRRDPAAGAVAAGGAGDPSGALSVAYARLLGPDSLALAVWVCNRSGGAASPGATVAFAPNPALAATVVGGPPTTGPIAPRGSAALLVSVALTGLPAVSAADGHTISLTGSATPSSGGAPFAFTLELSMADLVRPAPLDTPKFGAAWQQPANAAEAVAAVAGSSLRSPDALLARAQAALGLHPVQAIAATSEAIAAGRLMGTQNLLLLHARVGPAGLELRLRTGAPPLTQAVLAAAAARLR